MDFKKRIHAFYHAIMGIGCLLQEFHFRVHCLAVIVVVGAAWYLGVSATHWAILILAISIVMTAEACNSAIERICNKIQPQYDLDIKYIKDIAAAAVLLAAFGAVWVAVCVLYHYL